MKSPLNYQVTRYDCGKTSFINALAYLYEREEIPPQVTDYALRVTGDCNLGVKGYMRGTSSYALAFMAAWCNDYLAKAGFPIRCQALRDDEVSVQDGATLLRGIESGAVAVCGCYIGVDHYVLITGVDGDDVLIFDPYYDTWPPQNFDVPDEGVVWVDDHPFSHNRRISKSVLEDRDGKGYSLFAKSGRDAVLIWRTDRQGAGVASALPADGLS